jgi:RsiW-degrading membrane proteinase PrsW (M82 family)
MIFFIVFSILKMMAFVLILLIALCLVPVFALRLWLRKTGKATLPRHCFVICFALGIVSVAVSLLIQSLIPEPALSSRRLFLYRVFIRAALCEETARFLVITAAASLFRQIKKNKSITAPGDGIFPEYGPVYTDQLVMTCGLVCGLGFAALETAFFSLPQMNIALLRAVSSAPLHAACAARVARAVYARTERRFWEAARHFSGAVALHGLYDFFVLQSSFSGISRFFPFFGALLALNACVRVLRSVSQPAIRNEKINHEPH